jgi:hypothetical protein
MRGRVGNCELGKPMRVGGVGAVGGAAGTGGGAGTAGFAEVTCAKAAPLRVRAASSGTKRDVAVIRPPWVGVVV